MVDICFFFGINGSFKLKTFESEPENGKFWKGNGKFCESKIGCYFLTFRL
ncbi:hypothetical protein IQ31_04467 [Sphingobacterium siyangense]|uniref:Uncharacterized protein n=1 Tax=Sphingobacterium siyangense TaxID=459529 RepID=A0A562M940_9SPHI|nr:hypothetical protein IQ31_04467 [Sphingobacterium siyangense]